MFQINEKRTEMPKRGPSLIQLKGNFRRTATFAGLLFIVAFVCIGVLFGIWGWNRSDIQHDEHDIDKLQNQTKYLLADTFYVSVNGSDSNNGRSWKHAFLTVGKAAQASSHVRSATVLIGPGTFDEEKENLIFTNVNVTGTLEKVLTLHTVDVVDTYNYQKLVTVSEVLVPGALVGMFYALEGDLPITVIIENTANTILITRETTSVNETGIVYIPATTINILPNANATTTLTSTSTTYFSNIEFTSSDNIGFALQAIFPSTVAMVACTFDCRGNAFSFAREGLINVLPAYFYNCTVGTAFATTFIADSMFSEDSRLSLSQSKADLNRIQLYGQLTIFSGDVSADRISIDTNQSTLPTIEIVDSKIRMSKTTVLGGDQTVIYVQRAFASFIDTNISGSHFYNFIATQGSNVKIIDSYISTRLDLNSHMIISDSDIFFDYADCTFSGLTRYLMRSINSRVNINRMTLHIGNETNSADKTTPKLLFDRTNVRIDNSNISLTELVAPGIIFSESQATISDEVAITVSTQDRNAVEISDNSVLTFGENSIIALSTNLAANTSGALVINDKSSVINQGFLTLVNPLGSCLVANRGASLIQNAGASTTFTCGTAELFLQYQSGLIFDAASNATLVASANVTVLGSDTNATTFYLGTPSFLYTDGTSGSGIQGCTILVTAP